MHELRRAIVSSTADEGEVPFSLKRVLGLTPMNATPIHLTFALRDERLVVGLAEGHILIYNSRQLLSPESKAIQPLKATPLSSVGAIRQLLANSEDLPGLVAVQCDIDGSTDDGNGAFGCEQT